MRQNPSISASIAAAAPVYHDAHTLVKVFDCEVGIYDSTVSINLLFLRFL